MKVITCEEHFALPPVPGAPAPKGLPPLEKGTMVGADWLSDPTCAADLGEKRIGIMDRDGVTMQIISSPFGQSWPAEVAEANCKKANDYLYAAIQAHPDRFAGMATVPTAVPEACAAELERCVKELGFVGVLIGNRVSGNTFLDDPCYDEFLAKCEELNVPIYLHPGVPPQAVIDTCYSDERFRPEVVSAFSRFGMGWHVDVGVHMLHMIVAGVFDKYPKLQIVLGHWGELLPYYVDRFDTAIPGDFLGLKHDPSYYIRNNTYATSSGVQSPDCQEFCLKILGEDRIMFSADYPFANYEGSDKLLCNPNLTEEQREKFAWRNAARLYGLKMD